MISVGKKWRRSENAEGKQREFHQMKRESSLKRDLKKTAVIVHVTLTTTKTSTPFVFPYIILQIVFPYIILQIVCVSIIELYRTCDSALYTLTLFFF